jgi:RepB plasmid partitioning protein/ParB-like nuclease domain
MSKPVFMAFDPQGMMLPVVDILPLKQLKFPMKSSQKYQQVLASVREIGVIEPLIVFPQKGQPDTYMLLDGHIRLEVLKQLGQSHARCLISTDDETYTYNKRVNRMATIQEHAMILKATKNGVSEERIARVLKVDVASIRQKRDLLNGVCREAAELLKNRHVSLGVFSLLKKMKAMRQIEVAELLIATGNFSVPYVKALFASTQQDMLVDSDKHKAVPGLTPEQITKMEKEMQILQRDLKQVEDSHGNQVLNLVLARGYLGKLFGNSRVVRYLSHHHADIFQELQAMTDKASLEN